ncbi:Coenzyme F420 hydrogenase/dehydrogenase, beta subunit C-terminal domain [Marseilla massiliensis]|uniref:Coenzyme F420 hydrogenase/dehydrogenase, beta subunit C-terminal domain n=1 Tax=Marseilla massiliensis TaxID=1841864 RepID=UPI0021D40C9D|nr:Coenzyme F420 hydrogenase/dehydrogenase, beta subunit C-terminal domain [Marseilla massiliensis]
MTFTYLFYQHIMFRPSCSKCHFANTKRPSDITIADYWGWEKTDPDINKDDKGVSLILINTEKGRELFNAVKDRMTVIPAELENCMQPNLQHPSVFSPEWKNFERDYECKGFEYVMKKYGEDNWRHKIRKILRRIKRKIKRTIGL